MGTTDQFDDAEPVGRFADGNWIGLVILGLIGAVPAILCVLLWYEVL